MVEVKIIGQMDNTIDNTFESANRVYGKDGLAPTLSTCGGGGQQPKVIDEKAILTPKRTEYGKAIRKDYESGNIKESRHNMTQLEPRTDGIANTLTTVQKDNVLLEKRKYRIRKLTPRECWKLMDFSDEDFEKAEKVNSNTQLYKEAGNSIVVNVLVAIIGQLLQGKEDIYKKGGD